jgi:hypothetical protein
MAMAMAQLFFTASASAAVITFFAASKLIGGPYGTVSGGEGACWALAAVAKTTESCAAYSYGSSRMR